MNQLTPIEISYKLALAIGWKRSEIRKQWHMPTLDEPERYGLAVKLREQKDSIFQRWKEFDHTDPAVILPIQKHFKIATDFMGDSILGDWIACDYGTARRFNSKSLEDAIALCAIEIAGVK